MRFSQVTVGELRTIIKDLPDDAVIECDFLTDYDGTNVTKSGPVTGAWSRVGSGGVTLLLESGDRA